MGSSLDHHITALYLNKYKWACVESNILSDSYRIKYYKDYYKTNNHKDGLSSGSSLLFDYMEYIGLTKHIVNIELLKKMIHLIATYDTWDWFNIFNKDDIYNKFQSLCSLYGIELFEESLLTKLKNPNEPNIFNDTDNLLLTIKRNKIENYMKNIDKSFYTGELSIKGKTYTIMYCFTNSYLQETFERMKSLDPTIDIYLINYGTGIALRSVKDDINVGDIAKLYGGGGHLGAGGFKISSNDQKKYLENSLKTTITINEVWW